MVYGLKYRKYFKGPLDSCLEHCIGLGLGVGLGFVGQRRVGILELSSVNSI